MVKFVSIIIPCYNSGSFLAQAIESVLTQTYSDFEVLIVDDGSTDKTRELSLSFQQDERIRYYYQENNGLSSARNLGIRKSKGNFIALLDADDLWHKQKLTRQMALFDQSIECGLVFSDFSTFNKDGLVAMKRNADRHTGVVTYRQLLRRSNFIYPSTVIFRREVIDCCGYFDESLKSIEDYDMWLRIAQQFKICGIQEPLTKIRIHESNMSGNIPIMLEYEQKVVDKHQQNLSWSAYRRRRAKIYFLNADRYVHQGRRFKACQLFLKGVVLDPFLIVDIAIFFTKFALGGSLTEKIRKHVATNESVLSSMYQWLYKRY